MAGKDNLRPANLQTPEERKENGRRGGVASGKARRREKLKRELLNRFIDELIMSELGEDINGGFWDKLDAEMDGLAEAIEKLGE